MIPFMRHVFLKTEHGPRVEIFLFTSDPIPEDLIPDWPRVSEPLVVDPAEGVEYPRHIVDLH